MEVYLKKYFWVLNFVVVIACAILAAKASNHVIEARYLADEAKPAQAAPVRRTRKPKPPAQERSKDGAQLASRNMFCSTCEPPEPVAETPIDTGPVSDTPPPTSLPLELVATNVAGTDAHSYATIRNSTSRLVGAYRTGQEIPTAGPIERIRGRYVDFRNTQTNRVERISLGDQVAVRDRPSMADRTPPPPSGPPKDELTAALDDGIKKVDDTNYEISRSLVEKVLANPAAIRGARIVPSIKNGKANGFKLYAIRPNSAFARIGLQNGDTIHAVNGFDLTTPDKALEVYTKVRESSSLSVSITRRGNPVNVNYTIR